jgi:hypothetical protein
MNTILGTVQYREAIADYLSKVKFNCDFKDNKCICQRVDGIGLATAEVGCCCGMCGKNHGYLESQNYDIEKDEFWIKNYKDKFNRHFGFYRVGIGCILEREFRSVTCNRYMCGFLMSQVSVAEGNAIYDAQDEFTNFCELLRACSTFK